MMHVRTFADAGTAVQVVAYMRWGEGGAIANVQVFLRYLCNLCGGLRSWPEVPFLSSPNGVGGILGVLVLGSNV